jgi:DNA-directed RNA polymerases I, II, and III subunit RPABC2
MYSQILYMASPANTDSASPSSKNTDDIFEDADADMIFGEEINFDTPEGEEPKSIPPTDDEESEGEESDAESEADADAEEAEELDAAEEESEDDNDDEEEWEDKGYLQKLDNTLKTNIIANYHPELNALGEAEVNVLAEIVRNEHGEIIDENHKTLPFITKYEKTRIIGERAQQINAGAKPFVELDENVIDGYLIALKEFQERKIPFIIKRPLPNGRCEYWRCSDLEII